MSEQNRLAIIAICREAIDESAPTDPTLFDRLVERLIAGGVSVNLEETRKAREQGPNLVAVFETTGGPEFIELNGSVIEVEGYFGGLTAELLSEREIGAWYPDLTPSDLRTLRFIERDGVRYFDAEDIYRIADRKDEERAARRVLSLVLPEEFLLLCENLLRSPATVLQGFIADLCHLESGEYLTNGGDERDLAQEYFRRCGARAKREETSREAR